ncbi:hypothetical protein ROZALSC1DRAFT_27874 [Rozella allomycis CSF55]|uniref:Tyrosine specific protein phosphatases domain-containing protein n=1 Tax=Rozella allomycis (strain CSF55) TaxID=988480 RepID=A0A4P9YLW1_ROZAC|nr:hypothetical protein ROZALSC1DRAFT_27874 [Rozella allomycis CSF55]
MTLTPDIVTNVLQLLIHPENLPVYLHCVDGRLNTGVIVMSLRKLQGWSSSSYINEYIRILDVPDIGIEENEFMEKYCPEIDLPFDSLPDWLWGGKVTFQKHPSFKIRHINTLLVDNSNFKEQKMTEKEEYQKRMQELLEDTPKEYAMSDIENFSQGVFEREDVTEISMAIHALDLEGLKKN